MTTPQTTAASEPTLSGSGDEDSTSSSPRLPLRTGLKILLNHLRNAKLVLGVVVFLSILDAAASLAQPLLVNRVITAVGENSTIRPFVMIMIGLLFFQAVLGISKQYMLGRTAEGMVRRIRYSLVGSLLRLPISAYGRLRTGDLVSRVNSDTTLVRVALTGGIVDAAGGMLVLFGSAFAMIYLDPMLFLVAFGVLAVSFIMVIVASGRIQALSKKAQESTGRMGAGTERALSAIRTIRASGATEAEEKALQSHADNAWRASVGQVKVAAMLYPVGGLSIQVAFLAVLGFGGARVASGALSVADLVAFLMFLFMMMMPIGQMFGAITTIAQALGALGRINEVLTEPSEKDSDSPVPSATPDLSGAVGAAPAVQFQDVYFSHEEDGDDVLAGLSFTADAGTTTALVGPSGAGKSTVLAMIERFHDPSSGTVRVGGVDIRDLDRDVLRSAIGYVEQASPALAGTIRSNLTLGHPDATEEECRRVLADVNLLERVESHEDGLDSVIGDHGIGLSGGERQRLAIARTLLSKRPLLLLDEPTASLDSRNERAMQQAIETVSRQRSVIIVAHRLATVANADRIVVIDGGQVQAVGTHSELMRESELYQDLARDQLLS